MDSELDRTIAALQSNVLACREVADLALLSAAHSSDKRTLPTLPVAAALGRGSARHGH